jgi:steroid 5-alpha reductase family enzyme
MIRNLLLVGAATLWLVWVVCLLVFRRRPELRVGTLREFVYPVAALVIGVAWHFSNSGTPGSWFLSICMRAGVVTGVLLSAVWVVSLLKRDAGIMDVAYPLAVAVPVVVLIAQRASWSPHEGLTVLLVGLWSVRMALHIGIRNAGHGKEDGRYAAWRKRFGGNWWWWSFFQVFMMQGVTVWLWSLGLIGAVAAGTRDLGWQHGLAVALFVVGFYFQVRGDAQLAHFKRTRTDRSMVLDTGLWSLTRHPNYFGESVLWWSFGALGLVHPWGWLALVCPLYVTWFMRTGSATPMQERYLAKTKPAYADYMRRVPRFFPWGKPK